VGRRPTMYLNLLSCSITHKVFVGAMRYRRQREPASLEKTSEEMGSWWEFQRTTKRFGPSECCDLEWYEWFL